MSAEIAETWGHQRLREFGRRSGAPAIWKELAQALAVQPKKAVSLRTFLRDSRRYKARLPGQGRSRKAVEALRFAGLPNFVWVIEVHDRSLRKAKKPSVIAEVLFDPHSSDHVHRAPRSDAIAMPGLTVVTPPDGGKVVAVPTPIKPWGSQLN